MKAGEPVAHYKLGALDTDNGAITAAWLHPGIEPPDEMKRRAKLFDRVLKGPRPSATLTDQQ